MAHVLVVDDSETARQLIKVMLEPEGYSVSEAEDGVRALEALRAAAEPIVVVLDYQMPNLDGAGVLRAVAQEGGTLARHEFLVLSGNIATFPESFIEMVRHLSIRILSKPADRAVLLAVVSQATERLQAPPDYPVDWPNGEPAGS
jgi:CheY-like chemotaxis protein